MNATPPLPYSTRLRIALAIARSIAAARGDSETTSTHIVLGLLREAENGAVAALQHSGVPLNLIRGELEAELGPPGRPRPDEVALPLTEGERQVLELARIESGIRDDPYVAPEHVLLGVLRDARCPAALVFAHHGLDYVRMAGHVDAVVHRHTAPPELPHG